MATQAQYSRQRARSQTSGRYTQHNPCELCGKSVGLDYWSDRRSDQTGRGVTLHEKCATIVSLVPDEHYVDVMRNVALLLEHKRPNVPDELLRQLADMRAGCVSLTITLRGKGPAVGVYRADAAGLACDTPWAVVCEAHGTVLCVASRKDATASTARPAQWCSGCSR